MLIENVQELLKEELDRAFVAHETLKYLWIKYPDMSIQDFLKLPMQVLVRAFGALGFLEPEYNFYLNFTNFKKVIMIYQTCACWKLVVEHFLF